MTEPTQPPGTSQGTDPSQIAGGLFQNGTAQVGGMVTSIVLVAQAFGQLGIHPAAAPLAAFVFAALLAVYQVSILQKAPRKDCYVLVPIATLILFALAWGGTNSLAPDRERKALENELALVKEELAVQTELVRNANSFIDTFVQRSRSPDENTESAPVSLNEATVTSQTWVDALFGLFVSDASAQEVEHNRERNREGADQPAIHQEYERFRERQQELSREQQVLEGERQQLQQRQEHEQQRGTSFWKIW